MTTTARAHTNIALVKYWGKRDAALMLPQTDSLSLTLDEFYTTTIVNFNQALNEDQFYLDGELVSANKAQKVVKFMDLVRQLSGRTEYAQIASVNNVPMAAGLASSASAFAALAGAAAKDAGLDLSLKDLSRLARRGSGSATRSVYGGLVEWHRGVDDATSFAEPVQEVPDFDIAMLAILVDTSQKKVSSRGGMQLVVETSPYYPAWREVVKRDMVAIKEAIANRDLPTIGHIAQENALRMHALNLAADPGFTYFDGQTILAMQTIDRLREEGLNCYYTMDAGPNVKVIFDPKDQDDLLNALTPLFGAERLVVAKPGPGIEFLTEPVMKF